MTIPRPWFIALIVIFILPWLLEAAIWFKPANIDRNGLESAPSGTAARAGEWGELTLYPIVISPPLELVFTDWGFMRRPTWYFPGASFDRASQMLQLEGVTTADVDRLRSGARFEPQIKGVVLTPDTDWVRALSPEIRARVYHMLAKNELNVDQRLAFKYPGTNPELWLGSNLISPQTRRLVEPLLYRDGGYMLFSDVALVRKEIGSEDLMRRLGKVLSRQPTVIVHLSVTPSTDLNALVEYWGRGGRRTDIRPLIESVAGRGINRSIDVIHLLPAFARNHLYRYPKLSAADLNRPIVVNCLWTSLNFFRTVPDDRFLDGAFALKTLKEDYFIVETDFELGDIVAFLDEEGNIFHAGVYIADDLLFSKNGISAMAPWTLMTLDDVKGYYRWRSENPRLIVHRRKDLF